MNTYIRNLLAILMVVSAAQLRADTIPVKKRIQIVGFSSAAVYGSSLVLLNQAWYANYPQSSFHWINDNHEWLQMDKYGHVYSSYFYGVVGIDLMRWTGIERKKAIWIGGLAGTLFQTPIEILDGFSEQWGASAGDLICNSLGTALVISQELAWDEQRIQMKYSFSASPYAGYRPNTLGSNYYASALKDYNGQTYWLSVNPSAFMKKDTRMPKWLNLSLGFGADGMFAGSDNTWTDSKTGLKYDRSDVARNRQFYFALDVDMTRIPVKSRFFKENIQIPEPGKVSGTCPRIRNRRNPVPLDLFLNFQPSISESASANFSVESGLIM